MKMKFTFFKIFNYSYYIGILVFITPIFNFFKPKNFVQISNDDLYLIILSLILLLIITTIIAYLLDKIFYKIFAVKNKFFFIFLSFSFYSLFFYTNIRNFFLDSSFTFVSSHYLYVTLLFFIIILLLILIFICLSYNFFLLFKYTLLFNSIINIIFILFLNINFSLNKSNLEQVNIQNKEKNESINKNFDNNKKIFYIILDAMVSLELAEENKYISNKEEIIKKFEKLNLKYIKNSISTYDSTRYTLQSLFSLKYPYKENVNYSQLIKKHSFPNSMYLSDKKNVLLHLLKEYNTEVLWIGNNIMPCKTNPEEMYLCRENNFSLKMHRLANTIFLNSIFEIIIKNLIKIEGQRIFDDFISKDKFLNNVKNQFIFIHKMSPHDPFNVDAQCNKISDKLIRSQSNYEGYKNSYNCVLNEVIDFTKEILSLYPQASIVFQGDHGYSLNSNTKERANIFNAIKVPDTCLEKNNILGNSLNTMIFLINCEYNLDYKYYPKMHYIKKDNDSSITFEKLN